MSSLNMLNCLRNQEEKPKAKKSSFNMLIPEKPKLKTKVIIQYVELPEKPRGEAHGKGRHQIF
jgi:hypothetical protein